MYWSIIQFFIIIGTCYWQMRHLKVMFFEKYLYIYKLKKKKKTYYSRQILTVFYIIIILLLHFILI